MKFIKGLLLVMLGFFLYPLLFIPLMLLFAPKALETWILVFADYLRLWGIR
jgi:hypothetical protein